MAAVAKDSTVEEDSRRCSSRGDAACDVGRRVARDDGGIDGVEEEDSADESTPNGEWPWVEVDGDSGMGTIPGSIDTADNLHFLFVLSGDIIGATKRLVGVMPVLLELFPSESFVD